MPSAGRAFAICLAVAALGLVACGSSEPSARPRTVEVRVGVARVQATVAADESSRRKGLAGRPRLAEDRGMLFVYRDSARPSYWMKGMRFPIDIVWIDRGRVTEIESDVPVPSGGGLQLYSPAGPIDQVLEVRAGWAARHGVKRGDRVSVR